MKRITHCGYVTVIFALFVVLVSFLSLSCGVSRTPVSSFYDAGAADFTPTGAQFFQFFVFRFDTSDSPHTLTTPTAADIVAGASATRGEVLVLAVSGDGAHAVTISGGTGVTIKPSASSVAPGTTQTIYCVIDIASSGSEAATMY